jgi:FAD synthase
VSRQSGSGRRSTEVRFPWKYSFEFREDLYGKEMEVAFVKRLRGEEKFSDIEALVRQIQRTFSARGR